MDSSFPSINFIDIIALSIKAGSKNKRELELLSPSHVSLGNKIVKHVELSFTFLVYRSFVRDNLDVASVMRVNLYSVGHGSVDLYLEYERLARMGIFFVGQVHGFIRFVWVSIRVLAFFLLLVFVKQLHLNKLLCLLMLEGDALFLWQKVNVFGCLVSLDFRDNVRLESARNFSS